VARSADACGCTIAVVKNITGIQRGIQFIIVSRTYEKYI
jgi:hypothetical protein